MSKLEENDLFIFIEALKTRNYKGFKKVLITSTKKNQTKKLNLFEDIAKGNFFDKKKFIDKHDLTEKQFSTLKFQLFQDLMNFLKVHFDEFSDVALHNNIIEFELLLNKGLFIKAVRKFKRIKEIALEKCDFNACCTVQIKAIEHGLYKYISPTKKLQEASAELREYQNLSANLYSFKLLLSEVLEEHYTYLDRRAENSDEILVYLEHTLLQDEKQGLSILAKFYYYRIKSTVYYGNNQYQKTKEYSLKAYQHLKNNTSAYRNDYLRNLICLNNYIDASFYLKETEPFEIMFPQMLDIVKIASDTSDTHSNALIFQILATLKLNYFWMTKNTTQFYKEITFFTESYIKYESILRPNFKLEIIIIMANMYFLAGDLKKANEYCKKIDFEKSNPTSSFVSCLLILRIMINFDLKNHQYIPHLVRTSKYYLKKRDRLFELEQIFFNSFNKIKFHNSFKEQLQVFDNLYNELSALNKNSKDKNVVKKIGLIDWVKQKSSFAISG